eukprot:m.37752 g.37752  ORF g.37752 m.37752 type:complete len:77 (+) comp10123_c0_seq1:303-533(+)
MGHPQGETNANKQEEEEKSKPTQTVEQPHSYTPYNSTTTRHPSSQLDESPRRAELILNTTHTHTPCHRRLHQHKKS